MMRQAYVDILSLQWEKPAMNMLGHIFPMSGAFFHFDVDIVLAQEHFIHNWENVVVPTYKLPPNSFNKKLGYHRTSVDHPVANTKVKPDHIIDNMYKFRQLFRSIKKADPSLWLVMCRLILIDFVCFPQFKLPSSCRSLQKELDFGRTLLLKNYGK